MAAERRKRNRSKRASRPDRRIGMQGRHQNLAARHKLLDTAPRMVKYLGSFTGALAGNTRVKLFNVGLITRLQARLTIAYTIGVAVAAVSPRGAYAAINRIKLVDFDGSDRINCSGWELYLHNSLMYGAPYGLNNQNATAVFTNPNIPTAVGAQTATIMLTIPVCADYDAGNLEGMLMAQTAVGELYLSIDWASVLYANGDETKMFSGGATTTVTGVSFTLEVWQEYLLPQSDDGQGVILPIKDLTTVYEIAGMNSSSSDIAVGSEKLINFPNVREVQMSLFSYVQNSLMGGGSSANDASRHRLIVNGNNVLQEFTQQSRYWEQRRMLNGDLGAMGAYVFDFRKRPIKTWLYGNVQYGITPGASVAGTTFVEYCFVSTYQKGTVLPGLGQNG